MTFSVMTFLGQWIHSIKRCLKHSCFIESILHSIHTFSTLRTHSNYRRIWFSLSLSPNFRGETFEGSKVSPRRFGGWKVTVVASLENIGINIIISALRLRTFSEHSQRHCTGLPSNDECSPNAVNSYYSRLTGKLI